MTLLFGLISAQIGFVCRQKKSRNQILVNHRGLYLYIWCYHIIKKINFFEKVIIYIDISILMVVVLHMQLCITYVYANKNALITAHSFDYVQ